MNREFQNIVEKIEEYSKIVIFPHKRADGDCTGAAIGLKEMLISTFPEKEVYISGTEADYLRFLGDFDQVTDEFIKEALGIVVDTAGSDRVDDQRFKMAKFTIRIYHHIHVEEFCQIEYINTGKPATCEIILDLLTSDSRFITSHLGLEAIYTGILTDTGRFRYRGTSSNTFRGVATLIDLGLDYERVNLELSKQSENVMRLKGDLLLNYRKTENGFAYFVMTDEMIKRFDVNMEEASSLVNELSVIESCPVWGIILEYKDENTYRVRLRSKGPVINELCSKYEGGGHAMACGATLRSYEAIDGFIEDVDNFVKQYKNNN